MLTLPSAYTYSFSWLLPTEHEVDVTSYSAGLYSLRPNDYVIVSHDFVQVPDHVNIAGNHQSQEEPVDGTDPNL